MVSLSTPNSTTPTTLVTPTAHNYTQSFFADDDPENKPCRSLFDPSVAKMCKGDLIAILSITFWLVFVFWFWFFGYRRLKTFYHARLAAHIPFSCSCMHRKGKSNATPPLRPLRARTEPDREKAQGEPGPLDPYLIVPRRISDSLITPTRPPSSPPPTYTRPSRKSIQDPTSYAFSGRTADANTRPRPNRLSTSSLNLGLGFSDGVLPPSPDPNNASTRPRLSRLSTTSLNLGLGFNDGVLPPSPALTADQPFLNFTAEPRETSTPKKDARGSVDGKGVSPKSAGAEKKEGWVWIERV